MTRRDKERWLENKIRDLSELDSLSSPFHRRVKRQEGAADEGETTLVPVAFSNMVNEGVALELVTLSPQAFISSTLGPEALAVTSVFFTKKPQSSGLHSISTCVSSRYPVTSRFSRQNPLSICFCSGNTVTKSIYALHFESKSFCKYFHPRETRVSASRNPVSKSFRASYCFTGRHGY